MEQFRDLMLLQLGADDAELAGDVGAAGADLVLAGDHVELVPGVAAVHNALGAQDHAVSALVQRVQGLVQILTAVFVGRLLAPAREHLVGVVVMVVMMPAGADAVLVVVVLMVMLVLVLIVVVMAAVVVVVIVIMVVMVMLVLVLIVVLVVMMMAAAVVVVLVLIVVVMVMMVVLVLILVGMGHVAARASVSSSATRSRLPSMTETICAPVRTVQSVVTMVAVGFFSASMATAAATFSSLALPVRLRMMQDAWLTWSS